MERPRDRTAIWIMLLGEPESHREYEVLYERFLDYDALPDLAKSEDTKKEYEEFWAWKRNNSI